MTIGKPTGNQIAFFIFATWLLAVPLTRAVERSIDAGPQLGEWLERGFHILMVGAALLAIPPLRERCMSALAVPITARRRREVGVAVFLSILAAFAFAGLSALWWFATDGPLGLQQRITAIGRPDTVMATSLQPTVIATQVAMAVIVVPIVEEIVFRLFLFRAWLERHGWVIAMLLSSTVFAMLHSFFFSAFLASIVYTCVYWSTGSLRSSILVHAAHNLLVCYPLLGQFIIPLDLEYPGDLASWSWHLGALGLTLVALPLYVWISCDRGEAEAAQEFDHVALPR